MSTTDNGHDIEFGVPEEKRLPWLPEEPSGDVLGMYIFAIWSCYWAHLASAAHVSLRDLQAELNAFLAAHTAKLLSLQASLSSTEQHAAQVRPNTQSSAHDAGSAVILVC